MKAGTIHVCGVLLLSLGAGLPVAVPSVHAESFAAWSVPTVRRGNFETKDEYGVCNDFEVLRPIIVSQLGMFDHGGDGIQGSAVVRIQLYEASGPKATLLLETMTFDAASPGELRGGFRFKPLARPVTLWPGRYTLAANGFDATNRAYNVEKVAPAASATPVILSDGGGRIRFLASNRYHEGNPLVRSKQEKNIGPPDRFAAGSFVFSEAKLPAVSYAADHAALTAGVRTFPTPTSMQESNAYAGVLSPNRYGSMAVLNEAAFPVLVEPGGSRLIFEAAGMFRGDPNAARCVAFAHEQWGREFNDNRAVLFDNAIRWASRKGAPADIVMGLSPNLDAAAFAARGYQVRPLSWDLQPDDPDPTVGCDVLVVDFYGEWTETFMTRVAQFVSRGGGLVSTFLPRRYIHRGIREPVWRVNALLEPFGLAYRTSLSKPLDFGFTNVWAVPYPVYFQAFPAAELLYKNRKGQVQLDSLSKAIAMNTVAYAGAERPDLLAALTAMYSSGTTNLSGAGLPPDASVGNLVDVLTLNGARAATNYLGVWTAEGATLVSRNRRGAVEYEFNAPAADMYRLQIEGTQAVPSSRATEFVLLLSVDGVDLGRYKLAAGYGTNGVVECWTPYLLAGPHRLRVLWDGAAAHSALRLNAVRVQTAAGTDSNGDGIKDWVRAAVNSESGLDATNDVLVSLTSPFCLEGSGPFPSLINVVVAGADAGTTPAVRPRPAPNGRWYADVPLAKSSDTAIQIIYENGAKTETRQVRWNLVNVLKGGAFTIRKGDSLALTVRPATGWSDSGQMLIMVGTNSRTAAVRTSYRFNDAGAFTVRGTYTSPEGVSQSGSITVHVVEHSFSNGPACCVGKQRNWDVPFASTNIVLETDSQLFCEQIAALPDGGARLRLFINRAEPRHLLSRLGETGPILDSTSANGFRVFTATDTSSQTVERYSDGSRLVESTIILSPVLPDVKLLLRVVVGGVTLDDGTTSREITAADFDALGQYKARFLMPASVKTSNCHNLKVLQGDTVLAEY
jgi:hypothetical protein